MSRCFTIHVIYFAYTQCIVNVTALSFRFDDPLQTEGNGNFSGTWTHHDNQISNLNSTVPSCLCFSQIHIVSNFETYNCLIVFFVTIMSPVYNQKIKHIWNFDKSKKYSGLEIHMRVSSSRNWCTNGLFKMFTSFIDMDRDGRNKNVQRKKDCRENDIYTTK